MEHPRALVAAALLVGLQAVALGIWGAVEVVRALTGHPHDRSTAILLGVVVLIYAAGVGVAARGVWGARRWAQTPSYLVSFFAIVVGFGQVNHLPVLMVPLILIGAGGFVALSLRASREAFGGI